MDLKPFTQSKVIIVEGNDDLGLLKAMMQSLGLTGFDWANCQGKTSIPDAIQAVKNTSGFENAVTSLGIVKDADDDADSAFQSICGALESAGLDVPSQPLITTQGIPHITVMIWPCGRSQGILEDVCLESVAESREMKCVNDYFECLRLKGVNKPRIPSKAKVQAFLSARPETYPHLGVAASKGDWPLDHTAFNEIRSFLAML
jgi:hypothetical protein